MTAILRATRSFVAGHLLAWFLLFLSRLPHWRPDFHDLLPNWGMAAYMAVATAVPAGIGFGLIVRLFMAPAELASRRFAILAALAGAGAFAVASATALLPNLYSYGNRLGMPAAVLVVLAFCFEIFDPCVFKEVCPGKDRQYGLQRYLDAVAYCASLGKKGPRHEPWVTNGEIIVGLEPPESSIKAIDWITSVGAIPTVCVFRPLAGTDYSDMPPPQTEPLIPVFRRLYEACMEQGLPIGVAPNIHVSLVLLPDECRSLSDRRFPLQTLKLKLISRAAKVLVGRNVRQAAARATVGVPA